MIRAIGISDNPFDPTSPDRLCRGRERWIDPIEVPTDAPLLWRLVVGGAMFSDARANDAKRGFRWGGVDAGAALGAVFPGAPVAAFCEAGDPCALPDVLWHEEDWERPMASGLRTVPAVRWVAPCALTDVSAWMAGERDGVACPRPDGFLVGVRGMSPALGDALYALVGQQTLEDRPANRFDATAIAGVLEHCDALVLLHDDKDGPVLAIYTLERTDAAGSLDWLIRSSGAIAIPFGLPPMLARWDRAVHDLYADWDPEVDGDFPVPFPEDTRPRRRTPRGEPEPVETVEE